MTTELEVPTPAAGELPRAWWYGCWLEPGHYLFDRSGRHDRGMDPCPLRRGTFSTGWLDGGLTPRRLRHRAWLPNAPFAIPDDRIVFERMAGDDRNLGHRIKIESEECPQGDFLLHAIGGCTIAAWWDRTQGDERSACNSCLIVEGAHSADEMLELFPRLFPRQAERLAQSGVQLRFLRWAS